MKNRRIIKLTALIMCLVMCFAFSSCTFEYTTGGHTLEYIAFSFKLLNVIRNEGLAELENYLHPQAVTTKEDIRRMIEEQADDLARFNKAELSGWLNAGYTVEEFSPLKNARIHHFVFGRRTIKELDVRAFSFNLFLESVSTIDPGTLGVSGYILINEQGTGIYRLEIT